MEYQTMHIVYYEYVHKQQEGELSQQLLEYLVD
jgi:hypothetical protein